MLRLGILFLAAAALHLVILLFVTPASAAQHTNCGTCDSFGYSCVQSNTTLRDNCGRKFKPSNCPIRSCPSYCIQVMNTTTGHCNDGTHLCVCETGPVSPGAVEEEATTEEPEDPVLPVESEVGGTPSAIVIEEAVLPTPVNAPSPLAHIVQFGLFTPLAQGSGSLATSPTPPCVPTLTCENMIRAWQCIPESTVDACSQESIPTDYCGDALPHCNVQCQTPNGASRCNIGGLNCECRNSSTTPVVVQRRPYSRASSNGTHVKTTTTVPAPLVTSLNADGTVSVSTPVLTSILVVMGIVSLMVISIFVYFFMCGKAATKKNNTGRKPYYASEAPVVQGAVYNTRY